MITNLNHNSTSWVKIYKIDMSGHHPEHEPEEYFSSQLEIIVEQQYKLGYYLRSITGFTGDWILVFTPQNNNCKFPSGREN